MHVYFRAPIPEDENGSRNCDKCAEKEGPANGSVAEWDAEAYIYIEARKSRLKPFWMCSSPMETTGLNALPARLTALAMEEFPQHLLIARAPPNWHQETHFTCAGIPEEEEVGEGEEEGASNLEEERARRSFQQSLDSLCRSGRWRPWQDCRAGGGHEPLRVSLDSSDSDSV
ncbi:hypothetical protein ACEWY4_015836 [Coilia grayii]|uniref:Uncharacterized protein n=1 Tax=Coilia grayii TaxID=363190 RepID=A0ABD1JP81_9TELE